METNEKNNNNSKTIIKYNNINIRPLIANMLDLIILVLSVKYITLNHN